MYDVSDRFLEAVAESHRIVTRARLLTDPQFGPHPTGVELPILGGDVKMASTSDVKWTLDLTVPGDYWEVVQPYSGEVFVERGVDFGDGTQELVPLGYYVISEAEQDDAPYGPVRLTCQDRIARLIQNRVLFPYQVPNGTTHRVIFERLVNGRGAVAVEVPPAATQAAQILHDRFLYGGVIDENWTWPDAPAIVTGNASTLLTAYRADGGIPAQTMAAILIDYRILCHASINDDWTWSGTPQIVNDYRVALQTLWHAAGSPEPTVWLQDYATANGGTMPVQTQAAGIIKSRFESGLTVNKDWTWSDPPQIVTQYAKGLLAAYPGSPTDRTAATTWLGTFITAHGGGSAPEPIAWLEAYIAANGGNGAVSTAGYGAFVNGPAIPITWTGYDPDRYTVDGGQVVEDQTYDFLSKLADARDCVLRFDELGALVVELRNPDPDTAPIYTVERGRTGNLIKASRKTTRNAVYNIVSAYGSDPAAITGHQLSYNADPTSPIRWNGPFGPAPRYYASPLLRTAEQAAQAAATVLSRYTGLPYTVGLWTTPNPALRPLDVIAAKVTGLSENHVIDEVTIPLTVAGGSPVEITTRTLHDIVIPDQPTEPGPTPGGGGTPPTYPFPALALNIGGTDGQNHFNLGAGFPPGSPYGSGAVHKDFDMTALQNLSINEATYGFYLDGSSNVKYVVPGDGGRTSTNTKYPRWELRELNKDGSKAAWSTGTGKTHYLKGASAVNDLPPSKPEVVLAQIHDASDDIYMLHVHDTTVTVKKGGSTAATLTTGYSRNTMVDWKLEVVGTVFNAYWSDLTTPAYTSTISGSGLYFKTGAYAQSWAYTTGDTSETRSGAGPTDNLADFPIIVTQDPLKLECWHTGDPEPSRPAAGGAGSGSGTDTGTGGTADDGVQAAVVLGWGSVVDGDEFDYAGPPNSKWGMYDGPGHAGNGIRTPSAFNVGGGILTCSGDAKGNTGGMSFHRSARYCRVEWRIRTYSDNPSGSGHRYHPVLIMWPTSDLWPQGGEFDFFETNCESGMYEAYLHIPGNDGSAQEYVHKNLDIQNFHNYAFEWTSKGIKGWIDGVEVFNFPGFKQPPGPMQATIQLDNFFGSSGMEPGKIDAKWFRVYQEPT